MHLQPESYIDRSLALLTAAYRCSEVVTSGADHVIKLPVPGLCEACVLDCLLLEYQPKMKNEIRPRDASYGLLD